MNDRVIIAGTNSGCGKTTVTLAILAALKLRSVSLSSFKCGPDYIDPMFHRKVLGIPSYNLDPFFCEKEQLRLRVGKNPDTFSVIEGVMGYYDGVGIDSEFSTYSVAEATDTPVILVVNVKGMHTSVGAILLGFCSYRQNSGIKGVIFNGASAMLYPTLKELAAAEGLLPLGFLPKDESISVGSRHLGLVTAEEIEDLQERLQRLGTLAEQSLNLDGILDLGTSACTLPRPVPAQISAQRACVAVARDEAFCFLYEENLELLAQMGCKLNFFSPLRDEKLPKGVAGLYLPGGYPELYLKELSENAPLRAEIRNAIIGGMPTIAECGGFLYLHSKLDGMTMVGALGGDAYKTDRLQRFGYVTLTANEDNLLCKKGDSIRGHEFHYYDSTNCGEGFTASKPLSEKSWRCAHISDRLYLGFPHLYFPANPGFAENFIREIEQYEHDRAFKAIKTN